MEYFDINSISELHSFFGYGKPVHPLITVIDLTKIDRSKRKPGFFYRLNLYSASCKKFDGEINYGRGTYDFSEGSMMFTAPGQVLLPDPTIVVHEGWGLYMHPDFLNSSLKGREITELSFFGYDINEALHISENEKSVLVECLKNITKEISANMDRHTYDLILANLSLLFGYCNRFYDRQFFTRKKVSNDTVQKFEKILNDYFAQDSLIETGLPDVKYFASNLNLSPNYLADLLTKYTGKSTLEHIHAKLVDKAKALLWSTSRSVSEIAYDLGFEHPSHFTKLFKAKAGISPRSYRNSN
ncbi:helix-turn-helix domain-containing protein [Algoriphagus resistens]|uniref:helix-turn-helix domain-containing protein n=1 Tax=Algoriphagus resistens TaxID=1750590 RepID=UPI000716B7A2|nr:helix-turn-helix domain-containing protein [Algoriphagus resistens]